MKTLLKDIFQNDVLGIRFRMELKIPVLPNSTEVLSTAPGHHTVAGRHLADHSLAGAVHNHSRNL